jgi:hypothetical protein
MYSMKEKDVVVCSAENYAHWASTEVYFIVPSLRFRASFSEFVCKGKQNRWDMQVIKRKKCHPLRVAPFRFRNENDISLMRKVKQISISPLASYHFWCKYVNTLWQPFKAFTHFMSLEVIHRTINCLILVNTLNGWCPSLRQKCYSPFGISPSNLHISILLFRHYRTYF